MAMLVQEVQYDIDESAGVDDETMARVHAQHHLNVEPGLDPYEQDAIATMAQCVAPPESYSAVPEENTY